MTTTQIFINSKNKRSFSGFHPWILDRSLIEPAFGIAPGEIVELVTTGGGWIGRGIYNPASRIRVRLYQWDRRATFDSAWITSQLTRAIEMRDVWMSRNVRLDAVRLVNSEGDGLSGLIVDRFGDYLVVQVTALAMYQYWKDIVQWLEQRLAPKGVVVRIDAKTAANEGLPEMDSWVSGNPPTEPIFLDEFGVKLSLDLESGQKTGYYLDQRTNRLRAARWIGDGPMLDVCTYLGGFSLTACRHASPVSVRCVDSSAKALELAERNANANNIDKMTFVQADCFDYLEQLVAGGEKFQTVVLDPPRMAGSRNQIASALRAYHRLNLSAVNLLQSGGILITCSCSGRVSRSDFAGMLGSVAKRTRRAVQIIETLGADFDHPVDANCPESEYLKCFICRVE